MDKFTLKDEEQDFGILRDLEQQTSDNIRKQRSSDRITIKSKVILQSGNSSELLKYKIQGVSGDISKGGSRVMFPMPIGVGDIYRLRFETDQLNLPLIFARCMRCVLIREDAYEAGFSFFTAIDLSDYVEGTELDDDLL